MKLLKELARSIQTGHPCFVGILLYAGLAYVAHQQHDDFATTAMIAASGVSALLWVPFRKA